MLWWAYSRFLNSWRSKCQRFAAISDLVQLCSLFCAGCFPPTLFAAALLERILCSRFVPANQPPFAAGLSVNLDTTSNFGCPSPQNPAAVQTNAHQFALIFLPVAGLLSLRSARRNEPSWRCCFCRLDAAGNFAVSV